MEKVLGSVRLLLASAAVLAACALAPAFAAAAPLEGLPTSLGFSQEVVGKTSPTQSVLLSNPLPGPAHVTGVSIGGEDPSDFSLASDACAGATLAQGETCLVEVAFAPQAGGARSAELRLEVEGEATIGVALSGSGLVRRLTVAASASFPLTSIGLGATGQIALKNEGEAGVNVSELKIEGTDPGDYAIEGSNCVGFIGPGMSCTLQVRFSPGAVGAREAQLKVLSDGTPGETLTALTGEGAAPELSFEPAGHDFGLVEVHSGGRRTNLTLRNAGAAAVQLSNLEISGPGSGEFWISASSCWGATLAPGTSCGVEVEFNANDEGSSHAAVRVTAGPLTFEAPLEGRAERPRVGASPTPLDFGAVSVGAAATREVTLTNVGHLPVGFFIAIVSGGDVADFHLVKETCTSNLFSGRPRLIEPGESCTAEIRFEPTAPGAAAATLSFFGNGEGALQVPVEGTGAPAQVGLSPGSRDFGSAVVDGAGPVQSFVLKDESADPYAVDSATIVGADLGDFQILSDGCTEAVIEPGSSCAVTVRFAPGSTGAKSATLRVRGPGGVTTARLEGTGAAAAPVASPPRRQAGRVLMHFRGRPRLGGAGPVLIGHARCASDTDCVLRISGHLGRYRIATRLVRVAAGSGSPIGVRLPTTVEPEGSAGSLGVVVHWQAGGRLGGASRLFLLG